MKSEVASCRGSIPDCKMWVLEWKSVFWDHELTLSTNIHGLWQLLGQKVDISKESPKFWEQWITVILEKY